jgi:hypothetical protein
LYVDRVHLRRSIDRDARDPILYAEKEALVGHCTSFFLLFPGELSRTFFDEMANTILEVLALQTCHHFQVRWPRPPQAVARERPFPEAVDHIEFGAARNVPPNAAGKRIVLRHARSIGECGPCCVS